MMEKDPAQVLEAALKLPQEVRAAIAALILDSLDGNMDLDAEAEWVVEITRRVQQLDAGTVNLVPWSKARRTILRR